MAESTTIGQSVSIKGDLTSEENLTIEGQVDGSIELNQHTVTIGPNGRVTAKVQAKTVEVQGQVTGDITATETLTLCEGRQCAGRPHGSTSRHCRGRDLQGQDRYAEVYDGEGPSWRRSSSVSAAGCCVPGRKRSWRVSPQGWRTSVHGPGRTWCRTGAGRRQREPGPEASRRLFVLATSQTATRAEDVPISASR